MKKNKLTSMLYFIFFICLVNLARATSIPLLTFSPITPTTFQLPSNSTAVVQYLVTNMSSRTHTWMLVSANSLAQLTSPGDCPSPFVLSAGQSCLLTLQLSGAQVGGPQVCQQSSNGLPNPLQCYQPNPVYALNISAKEPLLPTFYAGAQNGNLYYSNNQGLTWLPTTPPAGGSPITSLVVTTTMIYVGSANGGVYVSFNAGLTWLMIVAPAPGFAVNGLNISPNNKLYIASANGAIFICSLNGNGCQATTQPAPGFPVNGVFATLNGLYAASGNGQVYFSQNKGLTWVAINGQPDGSSVKTVYVVGGVLYVGTQNEYVYTSTSLAGGGTWIPFAQTVYSLFASNLGVLAGTQGGFVFSLSTGNELGFLGYTPINALSFLG